VTTVGIGLLLFSAIVSYPVAFLGEGLMGAGFSFIFAPALALIQRTAGEEQRGRVTSIFGSLQEMTGIVSSVVIIALGSLVVIRPTLCGAGILVILTGAVGFRAAIRLRARVTAGDEPSR
jgi:hypothetical protein